MADTITILASGPQSPGTVVQSGQSLTLDGYGYGNVQTAKQVKSAPLDVSARSTLRITLTLTSMTSELGAGIIAYENGRPDAASLFCKIETAPAAGGPWSDLATFPEIREPGAYALRTIATHNKWVRSSHWFARTNSISDGLKRAVSMTFGIAAEALPAA